MGKGDSTVYDFEPKHTFECKNNILSGITLVPWLKILAGRFWQIDFWTYWLRVIFITLMATLNSAIATAEWLVFRKTIEAAEINPRPVFVLGHPRTGTTLLHNLLSQDTERFGFCNTFQAGFPSGFLLLERYSWLLAGIIDSTRPMDNMALAFDLPQEDELGTNVLSAGVSPYMPLIFMQQETEYRDYFSFKEPSECHGRPAVELWTESFLHLLKKLTVRVGKRRLVLKSPVHTARVKLLLQLFPEAQFVYIHREPYTVLQSAINMADKAYWYNYLSVPAKDEIMEFILNQFLVLFDEYMADRDLIPDGNLVEIRYEELEKDLVGGVRQMYKTFGWDGFDESMEPKIRAYSASIQGFQKNKHTDMPTELRDLAAQRLARVFEAQGYKR